MRIVRFIVPSFVVFAVGCAASTSILGPGSGSGNPPSDDPMAGPPHALGTVLLGESHSPNGGTSTPSVTVGFIPDTSGVSKACTTTVAGCQVIAAPKCGAACGLGEVCMFDTSCTATCQKPPQACTKTCAQDEQCYLPTDGSPAACRKIQSFDSGLVAFSGTSVPISMSPPYQYASSDAHGSLYLAGAQITAQAQGAQGAGFSKWQTQFTATSFMQSDVGKLDPSAVFGTGNVDVTWTAGADQVTITVSGLGGSAICKAPDAPGKFSIPREVMSTAMGDSSSVSIALSRQRTQIVKGIATVGKLDGINVQPEGWLYVGTTSSEANAFQGCAGGGLMCGGACTDTKIDPQNCGKCGNTCSSGICNNGACEGGGTDGGTDSGGTCTSCAESADMGVCASSLSACQSDSSCSGLITCLGGCSPGDTTCSSNCASTYSSGVSLYNSWTSCVCSSCSVECASSCK